MSGLDILAWIVLVVLVASTVVVIAFMGRCPVLSLESGTILGLRRSLWAAG